MYDLHLAYGDLAMDEWIEFANEAEWNAAYNEGIKNVRIL